MNLSDLHISYALPALLLTVALILKVPTVVRSWRDPDKRATWLFLMWACAVFFSVAPTSLAKINDISGVPNFAAPWTYSLLTAFCASCITMIITWREAPSARRRTKVRRVIAIYTGIVVALWSTFLLADVPVERVYDLDTYYANTPWMREHILLYLIAHMVSALVAAGMIWKWIPEVSSGWLKFSLFLLQTGYALGLVFDVTKLTAVAARWNGTDWDFLSTDVAPPFAILDATFVGIGFILPVIGPFLQKWPREQATYWALLPLARAIRHVAPSAAKAQVGRFAPLDLRVLQRQQRIEDCMLRLAAYYDHDAYHRAYAVASSRYGESRARGYAGAVAIREALSAYQDSSPRTSRDEPAQIGEEITGHLPAISRALYRPHIVDSIRQQVAPSKRSVISHA
ncbi:MAB_1171c family putative transporter [Streptomyces sp. HK10]|uniref:MAB_1171c family putative transporter n=1 Tax=Streptomyces sp. HK10 TaxID=3373255 RepID=UPI00374A0C03